MEDSLMNAAIFKIVRHTMGRDMRLGYHCRICGKFYAGGYYTIESEEYVVGYTEPTACTCGINLPLPRTFENEAAAKEFFSDCARNQIIVKLIHKSNLAPAHFNPEAYAEKRRSELH